MSLRKQKKFICALMAVLLLSSGMCFDLTQADSLFAYDRSPLSATCFFCSCDTFTPQKLCTSEMLGHADAILNIRTLTLGRAVRNTGFRFSSSASPGQMSFQKSAAHCRAVICGLCHQAYGRTTIVRYIHDQDGTKPAPAGSDPGSLPSAFAGSGLQADG